MQQAWQTRYVKYIGVCECHDFSTQDSILGMFLCRTVCTIYPQM